MSLAVAPSLDLEKPVGPILLPPVTAITTRFLQSLNRIVTPLGIGLPYTGDGGNLTVEFTVGAGNVHGVAQVF